MKMVNWKQNSIAGSTKITNISKTTMTKFMVGRKFAAPLLTKKYFI